MSKQQKTSPKYDLEERTTTFAKKIIRLCKELPRNPINDRMISQTVASAGSIGANYREANDALGKKDFRHKLRIARKESKECMHWLELLKEANSKPQPKEFNSLIKEAEEYRNILSSIIQKI